MIVFRTPLPEDVLEKLPEIRVAQVQHYLKNHGWWIEPSKRRGVFRFYPEENRHKEDPEPDFFPISEEGSGYVEWVESFVRMLSQCEQRSQEEVVNDLLAIDTNETAVARSSEQ